MAQHLIKYRKATPTDYEGILRLQHQNLFTTLQGEDLSQGFLSIEFTMEQIHRINSELGVYLAIQENDVIGYLMAESVEFAVESPLLAFLLNRLKDISFEGVPLSSSNLFVYGPVCIDRHYRGQKILEELFRVMLQTLRGQYAAGVAFVSKSNPRSFNAHNNKLGMRMIDEFAFKGQKYRTLVFSVDTK